MNMHTSHHIQLKLTYFNLGLHSVQSKFEKDIFAVICIELNSHLYNISFLQFPTQFPKNSSS